MADTNPLYEEHPNQYSPIRKLTLGRPQVSIGDLYIFLHLVRQTYGEGIDMVMYRVHDILPRGVRDQSLDGPR